MKGKLPEITTDSYEQLSNRILQLSKQREDNLFYGMLFGAALVAILGGYVYLEHNKGPCHSSMAEDRAND